MNAEKCHILKNQGMAPKRFGDLTESTREKSRAIVTARESSFCPYGTTARNTALLQLLYPSLPEDTMNSVIEAVECLIEIYHIFGLTRPHNMDLEIEVKGKKQKNAYYDLLGRCVRRCLSYCSEVGPDSWVAYWKYKTCAYYAYHEKQDLPDMPVGMSKEDKPNMLFGGFIDRFVLNRKLINAKAFESFALTINMSKMGMPRANKRMIKAAELKTAIHLTTEPKALDESNVLIDINYEVVPLTKELICSELKRTVREIFTGELYTHALHYEPFFPSTSANYNRTRGNMGAVGEFLSEVLTEEFAEFGSVDHVGIDVVDGKVAGEIAQTYGYTGRKDQEILDQEAERGMEHNRKILEFNEAKLKLKWMGCMEKLKRLALDEEPRVEPLGLPEALKVRVISKGPPLLYTFLVPLQKFLWKTLKDQKVFSMIGQPITEAFVQEMIGLPSTGDEIINGDYKASTDNLHSWVSECLANELIDVLNDSFTKDNDCYRIDEDHREMILRSLINHRFEIDGEWVDQKEGQLMGSVTSFPFLCMANAAFCRYALECTNHRRYRLVNRNRTGEKSSIAPLMINGDDCSLIGKRRESTLHWDLWGKYPEWPQRGLRENWELITSFGGLSTSVGKTLYSLPTKPIVVLNSTTYHLKGDKWDRVPYINMGILMSKKRSGVCSAKATREYHALGTLHEELKEKSFVDEEIWREVSRRFIFYNRKILDQCPDIPWWIPNYLGGPGLVFEKATWLDLATATFLISKSKCNHDYWRIRRPVDDPKWVVHKLVHRRLDAYSGLVPSSYRRVRKKLTVNTSREFEEAHPIMDDNKDNYSRFYKYLTVATLFEYPKFDLCNDPEDTDDKREKTRRVGCFESKNAWFRKCNNHRWANARKLVTGTTLSIREAEEILYEKKEDLLACVPLIR
jgi:hypothetical protein